MNSNMILAGALGASLGAIAILANSRPNTDSKATTTYALLAEQRPAGKSLSEAAATEKSSRPDKADPAPQFRAHSQTSFNIPTFDTTPIDEADAEKSRLIMENIGPLLLVTDEIGQVIYDAEGHPTPTPAGVAFAGYFQKATDDGVTLLSHRIATAFAGVLNDVKKSRYPNLEQRKVAVVADRLCWKLAADALGFNKKEMVRPEVADTILVVFRSSQMPLKQAYRSLEDLRDDVAQRSNQKGNFGHLVAYSLTPDRRVIRFFSEKFNWPTVELFTAR